MSWVVVRQSKKNPNKVSVIYNNSKEVKLHSGENAEQSAVAFAGVMTKQHGKKATYTAVEIS